MDDLSNLVNVEDDTPQTPAPPAPPATAALPADPPPAPPSDPDEAEAVDLPAGKHVPLAALRTVREENKQLREKASQAEQLATRLAQLEGQLQGYQQVTQQLQQQPREPQPRQAPPTDDVASTFARSLDLYRQGSNGQAELDVDKARAILGIVEQIAAQKADARVMPIAQATARDRSTVNYQWALQQKDPSGKAVTRAVVDEIWRTMPVEYTADPQSAKTLLFTAMGMERMNTPAHPAIPPPPIVTESVGGTVRRVAPMSDLEQRIAKDRGIKAEDWQKHTHGFKPGHTTVLED